MDYAIVFQFTSWIHDVNKCKKHTLVVCLYFFSDAKNNENNFKFDYNTYMPLQIK